jgi:hypothetical protein
MCHHPFHWLRQGSLLEDHLNDTARIQLFGHEHTNRIVLGRDWVRIAASAVHPDRRDSGWEPGYNWIKVDVLGGGNARQLEVTTFVRIWQERPAQFVAKLDRGQRNSFRQVIDIEPWFPSGSNRVEAPLIQPPLDSNECPSVSHSTDQNERSDPMSSLRDISLEFFKLTLSQKSAIAGKLGLIEEEDLNQPDFERFRRVFLRARDRGLISELEQAIQEALITQSA